MKDLTTGRPGKVLLLYTLPLFGSIIFQQLYNIADSFVAGRYIGTDALAAVGNAYEVTLICIALAFGCNIGTSVITARLYGEKRMADVHTCITTALLFAGGVGVVTAIIGWLSSDALLTLIKTPLKVMKDSADYLNIYLLGYPFLILYQVCTGVFSALGDSKTPFFFLAASSLANIVVDIWFVRDLGMGVPGVAWATFLCQSVSGIAVVAAVLRKLRRMGKEPAPLFSLAVLKKILRVAIPSALQQSFISVGNILIQVVINGFGTACMAGYAAAVKLNNMCITSVTALGNGMSNYTGQNLGAGKRERIRQGAKSGVIIGCTMAAMFTVVFLIFARPLVDAFITDGNTDASDTGVAFLYTVAPFYAMIAVKLMVDGVLRGGTQMKPFMIATMTDLVLRVALAFLLAPAFDEQGVWSAWPIGWAVGMLLSLAMTIRYIRSIEQAPTA